MLLRCENLEPPMSQLGQTRPFGDLGSMSGFSASGHCWAIYEYTPFRNGPLHLHGSIPRVRRRRRELVRRRWRFMALNALAVYASLAQKLLDSSPCVPFEAPSVLISVVGLFVSW